MTKSYDEILNEMKSAYYEKTGENPERFSDLDARFQAVASEVLSLYHFADYVLRQSFPQSAGGEYLDEHALLRGLQRKAPAKARGRLTFYLPEVAQEEIRIPAGVVCSVEGQPFLQYVTLVTGVIGPGGTEVTVNAEALDTGRSYNAAAGKVTVMVNPVPGVASVINHTPFEEGSDAESDSALRERLVNAFRTVDTGISLQSLEKEILKLSDVKHCRVLYDEQNDVLKVYVKTQYVMQPSLEAAIEDICFAATLSGTQVQITPAAEKPYTLKVHLKTEKGACEDVGRQAEAQIRDAVAEVGIGESLDLNQLSGCLYLSRTVKQAEISSVQASGHMIYCTEGELLKLRDIEVQCYE